MSEMRRQKGIVLQMKVKPFMQVRLDEGACSEPCNADYLHTGDGFAPSVPLLLCTEDEFREQNMRT